MSYTGMETDMIMMAAAAVLAAVYGIFASRGLVFLFNNLPDSAFDDPRAHIGKGDERFRRIPDGQGVRILGILLGFLFLAMGLVSLPYAIVGAAAIWMLLFAVFSLWLYGEVPGFLSIGLLLCAAGTIPFHASGTDMLLGAVACGLGIGGGTLGIQRIARRHTRVSRAAAIALAVGLSIGFLPSLGVVALSLMHGITMEWVMRVNAQSIGYARVDEETLRTLEGKGKAPFFSTRWRLIHFGRTPILMGFCVLSIFAVAMYPLLREMTRGLLPFI